MKRIIIALRIVATILLVGVVVTLIKTPSGITRSVGVVSGAVKFSIATGADEIYLSSALLGFIISLVATALAIRLTGRPGKFQWPLIWAILGIVSLTNEITRIFHNHAQVLLSFPLFQVIADWLSFRFMKDAEPKKEDSQQQNPELSPAAVAPDEA